MPYGALGQTTRLNLKQYGNQLQEISYVTGSYILVVA
jgi:hypothetical protein